MIGDTPETDIAGARAAGLRSYLVESGNPFENLDGKYEPTAQFSDLRTAANFLISLSVSRR